MSAELTYLPERAVSSEKPPEDGVKGEYPCPCCGCLTLPAPKEEAVAFICPVCFWENDVFTAGDDEPSDLNSGLTLEEGRKNYRLFGACSEKMRAHVRRPKPEELPR